MPKIVDWYLDFSKESYATLKSVMFLSKSVFKTMGNLKEIFEAKKYK